METYVRGKVESIVSTGYTNTDGGIRQFQGLKVRIDEGPEAGKMVEASYQTDSANSTLLLQPKQRVVLVQTNDQWQIADRYRLDSVGFLVGGFFLLILILARRQGLGSLLGMALSMGILLLYVVPNILAGRDPLAVSLTAAVVIMTVTLYLAHGFSKMTTIALFSSYIVFGICGVLAYGFVSLAHLTGTGSEEAIFLTLGATNSISLQGLFLAGIIIGMLGVLDDVTCSLTATISELAKDSKKTWQELFRSGMSVGREHIASLVNTLVLAYAGASMPLFLLFAINRDQYPWWYLLNSEFLVEEVVRTMIGSIGLVLAVPVTAFLAARCVSYWQFAQRPKNSKA